MKGFRRPRQSSATIQLSITQCFNHLFPNLSLKTESVGTMYLISTWTKPIQLRYNDEPLRESFNLYIATSF